VHLAIGGVALGNRFPLPAMETLEHTRWRLKEGLLDAEAAGGGFKIHRNPWRELCACRLKGFQFIAFRCVFVEQGAGGSTKSRRFSCLIRRSDNVQAREERPKVDSLTKRPDRPEFDPVQYHSETS
jgi:hypothetical protein